MEFGGVEKYSYYSDITEIRVMGIMYGFDYEVYYLIIKNHDDILHLARCLDSGTSLSIQESILDDSAPFLFTNIVFEYSKLYNTIAIVRGETCPRYTLVKVSALTPYDPETTASNFEDTTITSRIPKSIKIESATRLYALLYDTTDGAIYFADIDLLALMGPTI